jgi:hypothetical protein
MINDPVSMVEECVDCYCVTKCDDGSISITIDVPKRFASLWMIKLSQLMATPSDIAECDNDENK